MSWLSAEITSMEYYNTKDLVYKSYFSVKIIWEEK